MEQARINIIEPNGVRRSMALGPQPLIIGRDPECDITIGYDRASRHHAKIMFDGYRYYIIDLNSTNGTFLGKNQVAPNTPTEWSANVPVRIGDIYFHLDVPEVQEFEDDLERVRATETMVGYQAISEPESGGSSRIAMIAAVGLGLLCGCIGLGALGYALFIN